MQKFTHRKAGANKGITKCHKGSNGFFKPQQKPQTALLTTFAIYNFPLIYTLIFTDYPVLVDRLLFYKKDKHVCSVQCSHNTVTNSYYALSIYNVPGT